MRYQLARPQSDSKSLMVHLTSVEKQTRGHTVPALLQRWYSTIEPSRFSYLVDLYDEIGRGRQHNPLNGTLDGLSYSHMADWCVVTGNGLSALEVELLFKIDDIRKLYLESKEPPREEESKE